MTTPLICLVAYILGSIPFGLLLTRVAGLGDIRQIGSGNIGATNVLRTGKKSLAAITLLLDALKGTVAVLIALTFDPAAAPLAGLCALLGHMYPLWLRFRGGKGVATALGIWLGLSPWIFLGVAACWLLSAFVSRTSSIGALTGMLVLPLFAYFIAPAYLPAALLTMALVVWRHRANISRIIKGTEPKIGQRDTAPAEEAVHG